MIERWDQALERIRASMPRHIAEGKSALDAFRESVEMLRADCDHPVLDRVLAQDLDADRREILQWVESMHIDGLLLGDLMDYDLTLPVLGPSHPWHRRFGDGAFALCVDYNPEAHDAILQSADALDASESDIEETDWEEHEPDDDGDLMQEQLFGWHFSEVLGQTEYLIRMAESEAGGGDVYGAVDVLCLQWAALCLAEAYASIDPEFALGEKLEIRVVARRGEVGFPLGWLSSGGWRRYPDIDRSQTSRIADDLNSGDRVAMLRALAALDPPNTQFVACGLIGLVEPLLQHPDASVREAAEAAFDDNLDELDHWGLG